MVNKLLLLEGSVLIYYLIDSH